MNNLSDYLKKFKRFVASSDDERKTIADELTSSLGVPVSKDSIKLVGGLISISGPNMLKSQIFIKKDQILQSLNNKLQNRKITDIR